MESIAKEALLALSHVKTIPRVRCVQNAKKATFTEAVPTATARSATLVASWEL
jgi:hypothetical protein